MSAAVDTVAVRVTPDAERQIRGGHPWVYGSSITRLGEGAATGDLAVVFDRRRRFVAIGLYDAASPIAVRILHVGRPRTIDEDFWTERLLAARRRRDAVLVPGVTDAARLVHGENDGLPGLVVDLYDRTLVVKLYSSAWFAHLDPVVAALTHVQPCETVVLRLARNVVAATSTASDGTVLSGDLPDGPVGFTENGLRFTADVVRGQKTGHFLDQRDNRRRVGALAEGAEVLDVFSCTGGFSVHAAAGGARSVHSIDISVGALDAAAHHMELNSGSPAVAACAHRRTVGDAGGVMDALVAEGRTHDLVVVDPPSYAGRSDQVATALSAYRRLAATATRLVRPGGTLVQASCTARIDDAALAEAVALGAADSGRRLVERRRTGHAADHPVGFAQGAYLCAVFATVE